MARVTTTKHGVQVQGGSLRMGANLRVTFQRTLRIPDDGKRYPLPPGLGEFPLHRIEDYRSAVPDAWKDHGGVFMPLWQREALWLSFQGTRPAVAVKVGVGKVNALSGLPWDAALHAPRDGEQDYLVAPRQPWLDGINVGQGVIRQFVAMPLGMGYTVEGQVTGEERFGGIQLLAYDPKVPFPPEPVRAVAEEAAFGVAAAGGAMPPPAAPALMAARARRAGRRRGAEMGLAAGGRMEQKIYADEHGIETWDQDSGERVFVHIVNSEFYAEITGRSVPALPGRRAPLRELRLPVVRALRRARDGDRRVRDPGRRGFGRDQGRRARLHRPAGRHHAADPGRARDRPPGGAVAEGRLGGGGGIRTHGPLARTPVFKTGAIDHSATPPGQSRR